MIETLFLFTISFIIGGIPTGYLVVKLLKKKDVRKYGSGNIGFANVWRVAGIHTGISVLLIDAGKAFLSTYYFSNLYQSPPLYRLLFGLTVITGNIFNPFLKLKGGKGVATGVGVAFAVSPLSVLYGLSVFLITLSISRYVSLGSLAGVSIFTISNISYYFIYTNREPYPVIFSILLFMVVFLRHTSNIKRLIKGEENKIGKSEKNE